jgi:hypothetical protein
MPSGNVVVVIIGGVGSSNRRDINIDRKMIGIYAVGFQLFFYIKLQFFPNKFAGGAAQIVSNSCVCLCKIRFLAVYGNIYVFGKTLN